MGPEYGACGNDLRSFLKTAYQQLLELLDEDLQIFLLWFISSDFISPDPPHML